MIAYNFPQLSTNQMTSDQYDAVRQPFCFLSFFFSPPLLDALELRDLLRRENRGSPFIPKLPAFRTSSRLPELSRRGRRTFGCVLDVSWVPPHPPRVIISGPKDFKTRALIWVARPISMGSIALHCKGRQNP